MFGFLIKSEVNDDAVRLQTISTRAVEKYLHLSREQLAEALARDFPNDGYSIDTRRASFVYQEAPDFLFTISGYSDQHEAQSDLSALGRGKYTGFTLHVSADRWMCFASDGIVNRATAGAKKLAQMMEKKFGISDLSRFSIKL